MSTPPRHRVFDAVLVAYANGCVIPETFVPKNLTQVTSPVGEARGDVRGGQEALRGELRDGVGDGLLGVGDSEDGLVTSLRR
ncbi:hypothetical protein [Collinsella aerofaciens]|uniref:hypothetical protein n=1 Tax=Collinsella aerofaciens TaxID=74426 RepID=UPI0018998676|nr:hypothetical protein [Collinsella aerofaciens]MDB1864167.1 hypothetical protein [Collinsella aerofaciens]